ncbi:MAG: type II toxin-antitoxin system RelE/ParE family toxin [Gemmatimonadales bacterium]|nr:type II toxin-antitoxin system RelE/ParE family toxin [Gemmatimonadales bacterium]MYC88414.1 type II toxin-antitoxin system RelE/ParE family toxin [Candidatus Palauibacter denitrificans]
MTPESVVLRAAARRDVDEAITHYLKEAGSQVVLGFIDALQEAFGHIADNPRSGSPRHGHEVNLPGLRSWPLRGYPHLVFYMTGHNRIDVWRILHGRRDIPEWLRDS